MMDFIKNMPAYAEEYEYIVARRNGKDWWFWGAWNDRNTANNVALEIGGATFCRSDMTE